jgi:hypothetical protein
VLHRIAVFLLFALSLIGQTPKYELRGAIGLTSFVDDSSQHHLLLAPSARYYFWRRLGVEAELQYLRQSSRHHDVVFLPSLVYDLRTGRVVPYVSGGLGVMRSSFSLFTETEGFLQGGAGVKLYLDDHWYVAPEFKFGFDFHARVSGVIGYTWR